MCNLNYDQVRDEITRRSCGMMKRYSKVSDDELLNRLHELQAQKERMKTAWNHSGSGVRSDRDKPGPTFC